MSSKCKIQNSSSTSLCTESKKCHMKTRQMKDKLVPMLCQPTKTRHSFGG